MILSTLGLFAALAGPHAGGLPLPTQAATSAAGPTTAQDRPEWRDRSRPELRRVWDKLEGKPAPALSVLSEWSGTDARSWEDLRGKVVLIDMWAVWCGPCRAQFPHLAKLYGEFAEEGLEILGVHSAKGWEKQSSVINSSGLQWAFAADKTSALGRALGVQFIPCYFVVDKRGVMRVAGVDRGRVDEVIKALLAEPYTGQEPVTRATPEEDSDEGWPRRVEKELYAQDFRGRPAPAFVVEEWLTDIPSREGKVLMLDFWATWCGPCRRSIPDLNALQARFADDLVVIGISSEEKATVARFMEKAEMKYSIAVDPKNRMNKDLRIAGIPHVLLVSTDGIVRWQGFPGMPEDPLDADVVAQVIENDPGVAERRKGAQDGSQE